MKEARWRTFGHILRLPLEAPCQKAMQWYFEPPPNPRKYNGTQRTTLPIVLHNDIVETVKMKDFPFEITQFKYMEDLFKIRKIAADREQWKNMTVIICSVA